jgi:hypothetical protein
MKNKVLIAALALLGFASCKKEDIQATNAEGISLQSVAKKSVPLSGSMSYTPSQNYDMSCDCGGLSPFLTFSGTGSMTHLGNVTSSYIKPCTAPIFNENGFVGLHVGIECASPFVASNGDQLNISIAPYNVYINNTGTFTGTVSCSIAGGTGRFSNASGSFTGTLTIPPSGPSTFSNISGNICY